MSTNKEVYSAKLINTYEITKRIKDENKSDYTFLTITFYNPGKIKRINQEDAYIIDFNVRKRIPGEMPTSITIMQVELPPTPKQIKEILIPFIEYLIANNEIDFVINFMNGLTFDDEYKYLFLLPEIHTTDNIEITLPLNDYNYIDITLSANQKAKQQNDKYAKELEVIKKELVPQNNLDTKPQALQKKDTI